MTKICYWYFWSAMLKTYCYIWNHSVHLKIHGPLFLTFQAVLSHYNVCFEYLLRQNVFSSDKYTNCFRLNIFPDFSQVFLLVYRYVIQLFKEHLIILEFKCFWYILRIYTTTVLWELSSPGDKLTKRRNDC